MIIQPLPDLTRKKEREREGEKESERDKERERDVRKMAEGEQYDDS